MSGKRNKQIKKAIERGLVSVAQVAPWTPFEQATVPEYPKEVVYMNSRYQVWVRPIGQVPGMGRCMELSIKTRDKAPHHDWRDFQRIKNELMGDEAEAIELYPSESRLMDTANQYYLYVFQPGYRVPVGRLERTVSETGFGGSKQRPFEVKPKDLGTEPVSEAEMNREAKLWLRYPKVESK